MDDALIVVLMLAAIYVIPFLIVGGFVLAAVKVVTRTIKNEWDRK